MMIENGEETNLILSNISEDGLDASHLSASQERLNRDAGEIATDIVSQNDPKQVKDLIQLFNLNHTKKQVLRAMATDQLLDSIVDQARERITKRGDQFSNRDLLDYMDKMSNMLEKSQKQISGVDAVPAIQINQQNNINVDGGEQLDRESAQRVLDFVQNAMAKAKEMALKQSSLEEIEDSQEGTVYSNDDEEILSDSDDILDEESIEEVDSLDNLFNSEEDNDDNL